MIGGILVGVLLFMFLVFIHELGHFMAAKKAGVKVKEFGIGIPPKAVTLGKDSSGTEYTLNWIPLGGFVRLAGENPESDEFLAPDSFISASLPWKLIILSGGVVMNFLFARLIFTFTFSQGVKPITVVPDNMMKGEVQSYLMPSLSFLESEGLLSGDVQEIPVGVVEVFPDSLAVEYGLEKDDIILKIDDESVTNMTLSLALKERIGKQFSLTLARKGGEIQKFMQCPNDQCVLGVVIESGGLQEILPIKMGLKDAMVAGGQEIIAQGALTFEVLGTLGKNLFSFDRKIVSESVNKLSGPVGIVKFGDMVLEQGGIMMYLAFGGMISLALALFNILPIPALDGGRALSVLIQSVLGIAPEKYFQFEGRVNLFFFVVMMLLGVYIILLDLVRFWGVSIPGIG